MAATKRSIARSCVRPECGHCRARLRAAWRGRKRYKALMNATSIFALHFGPNLFQKSTIDTFFHSDQQPRRRCSGSSLPQVARKLGVSDRLIAPYKRAVLPHF